MRIDAHWLTSDATQAVFALMDDAGYQVFAVGGCVRNTLLGAPVHDIDMTTNARPGTIMSLAEAAGLRTIPTGIAHGTVTLLVDEVPYEITTFRRDVNTDGRRAVVAFSDSIEDDAMRRDFTMNALYADRAGTLYDPVSGLGDLKSRRIRFIEDAEQRIREDYLRSLRYFRFVAWYGDPKSGQDPDALDAIARNLDGLEQLSLERIGSEVMRLLEAPDPTAATAAMRATGVLARILPGADDTALGPLVEMENGWHADPLRRLAVIGGDDPAGRLRLSRKEAAHLNDLRSAIGQNPATLGYRLGAKRGRDAWLLSTALMGSGPINENDLVRIDTAAQQTFPLSAADLMPELDGPELGKALRRAEQHWIDSNFTLEKDQLIARLRG